ncbi:hypothetical protein Q9Q99_14285 [Curtobacterium flaccumfaciens]|nr:hypothetical protein Q9Q99_14285 [Curtobacterium flaccumfaciens]
MFQELADDVRDGRRGGPEHLRDLGPAGGLPRGDELEDAGAEIGHDFLQSGRNTGGCRRNGNTTPVDARFFGEPTGRIERSTLSTVPQ